MSPAALAAALALSAPSAVLEAPPVLPLSRGAAERLADAVVLDPSASAEDAAVYAEAMAMLVRTPTGRSLAERFAALPGGTVTVRFADLEAVGGRVHFSEAGDAVVLGRGQLAWKREWAVLRTVELLGHELLGHALSHRRARAAGVAWEHGACLEDEVNAGLVGVLVGLEAGWRFLDPWAEGLLKDRAAYERALHWRQPEYAVALREDELADPVGALEARLALVPDRLEEGGGRRRYEAALTERLELLRSRPDLTALLKAYAAHPFREEMAAEVARRLERLAAVAPPPPGLQSPAE